MRSLVTAASLVLITLCPFAATAQAADASDARQSRIDAVLESAGEKDTIRFPIGRTAQGTLIWCLAQPDVLEVGSSKQRRLIVGGLDGSADSVTAALATFDRLSTDAGSPIVYACIPIADPDRWTADGPVDADAGPTFPPEGNAYNNPETIEAHVVWRFVGWFAPDVVVEIHSGDNAEWQQFRKGELSAEKAWPENSLAAAVRRVPVAGIATALSLREPATRGEAATRDATKEAGLLAAYRRGGHPAISDDARSPLRAAVLLRVERTPVEVARQLSQHYGDHLKTVMYQPALALVARLRLGELTGDETHRRDVEQIVSSYVAGNAPTLPENPNGSLLAGHLIFAELARLAGDPQHAGLVRRAADFGFDEQGTPLEVMPFHSEMSDAVFMSCPILTAAARSTGEETYLGMAGRHLAFMQGLCLRDDGIYRHSPLCEAAWGRGNGFPALGLALCLADLEAMPASPARDELLQTMQQALQEHLRALAGHQDVTGMWRQVIDDPGTYREMTSTCMITYAMVRGVRSGWLDEAEFSPTARRAWEAIKVRVGADGVLLDVCTGTGKQKSLQDYWNRTAVLGRDERGGAMALMAAVEVAAWEADAANPEARPAVPSAGKSTDKQANPDE